MPNYQTKSDGRGERFARGDDFRAQSRGDDGPPRGYKTNCVVVAWEATIVNLVMQVEGRNGNTEVYPVKYTPKPVDIPFNIGDHVRVFVSRSGPGMNFVGRGLAKADGPISPVPFVMAEKFHLLPPPKNQAGGRQERSGGGGYQDRPGGGGYQDRPGGGGYQDRPNQQQRRGPPKSYERLPRGPPATRDDDKNRNNGFAKPKPSGPSGDASFEPPLSPSCDLPARSGNESSPLPKQIDFSAEEEARAQDHFVQESNLFGVEAEVIESDGEKKLSFVEEGCTYYGYFEVDLDVADVNDKVSTKSPDSVKSLLHVGQKVLADFSCTQAKKTQVIGVKITKVEQTPPPPAPVQEEHVPEAETSDLIYLGDDEPQAVAPEPPSQDYVPDIPAEETYDPAAEGYYDETGEYVYYEAYTEEQGYDPTASEAPAAAAEHQVAENSAETLETASYQVPIPVEPVADKFEPMASQEDLLETLKVEKKLSSIYSCDSYVDVEGATAATIEEPPEIILSQTGQNDSGIQIEDVSETVSMRKPASILEPIKEEVPTMNGRQIAETAAKEAVELFMTRFLKYDEMAIEALLDAFDKKFVASIADKYGDM